MGAEGRPWSCTHAQHLVLELGSTSVADRPKHITASIASLCLLLIRSPHVLSPRAQGSHQNPYVKYRGHHRPSGEPRPTPRPPSNPTQGLRHSVSRESHGHKDKVCPCLSVGSSGPITLHDSPACVPPSREGPHRPKGCPPPCTGAVPTLGCVSRRLCGGSPRVTGPQFPFMNHLLFLSGNKVIAQH